MINWTFILQVVGIIGTLLIAQSILPQLKRVFITKRVVGLELNYFWRLGVGALLLEIYSWFYLEDILYTILNAWTALTSWSICYGIIHYMKQECTAESFADCKKCTVTDCNICPPDECDESELQ